MDLNYKFFSKDGDSVSVNNTDYEAIATRIRTDKKSGFRTAKREYIINFCKEWDKARFKLRGGRR